MAGLRDLVSQQGAGQQVAAVLASADPVVRMRAIQLVFGLTGQSQSAMEAVQQSGVNITSRDSKLGCLCCQDMYQPVSVDASIFCPALTLGLKACKLPLKRQSTFYNTCPIRMELHGVWNFTICQIIQYADSPGPSPAHSSCFA